MFKGKTEKDNVVVCNTAEQKIMLERIAGKIKWEDEKKPEKPFQKNVLEVVVENSGIDPSAGSGETSKTDTDDQTTTTVPKEAAGELESTAHPAEALVEAVNTGNGNSGRKKGK